MKSAATLIVATLLVCTTVARAQYARATPYETSVTQLQKALSPSTTGIQHFRWVSLRLLADPAMNPLFEYLTKSQDIGLRVDGFMGMALVSADKSLNAQQVNQLKDPALRRLLITEALGLDLLKPAALNSFLLEPDLTNYERALLVAELHRQGQPWDKSLLLNAASDDASEVAGLASMLLLERADTNAWLGFTQKCATLPIDEQAELLAQLANAARQYRITAALEPLLAITAQSTGAERAAVIIAAVSLSPTTGQNIVLEKIKTDRTQSNLVKMGLLMLSSKTGFQASDFELLRNGDPLVEVMVNAGVAMRSPSSNQAAALGALLENGNRSTSEFVLSLAATLPNDISLPLLLETLNRIAKGKSLASADQIVTLLAVQQLLRIPQAHPELLKLTLASMDKNIELVETIMSVVADSSNADAAAFARSIRGKLPRRGESMALLALAKNFTPLTAEEIAELGSIASGGGKVNDSLQIQAAWLYLKYANQEKDAITKLVR